MWFFSSTKKLCVDIPKEQYRQLHEVAKNLNKLDPDMNLDILVSSLFGEFLDDYYINAGQKLVNKLKRGSKRRAK